MNWGDDIGGGFMNDSMADEPQQLTSSISVGGEDKSKNIASVSVGQINKFTRPNEGLVLYGKKVFHLNLVGVIYEILDKNSQKLHLLLDDQTSSPIEVTHIIGDIGTPGEDPSLSMFHGDHEPSHNNGDEGKRLCDLTVGDYVRCIGVVKYTQEKANFIAYNLRYIDDPTEVIMHTLEVIRDGLFYQRIQSGLPGMPLNDNKAAVGAPAANPEQQSHYNQTMSNTHFGRLSNRDKHLLSFLREKNVGESGMSLDEIAKNFKAFSRKDIEESLSALSTEGLCWQGDTEDIWCVNETD